MLDYFEGNLSSGDIKALKLFAALHPELELNFDEELVTLEREKISFGGKQNLKADFNDELVIGYLENVLEGAEKTQAEKLAVSNTVFIHELELYKKTIAVADRGIVFENKEKLKRRGAVIFFPQNNYVRVAAALILLFGLWFMVARLIGGASTSSAIKNIELAKKDNLPTNTSTISNLASNTNENVSVKEDEKLVAKNSIVNSGNTYVKKQKEINTSTVSVIVPENKEEPQLADRNPKEFEPFVKRDTNTVLMANNNSQEKLNPKFIIEEGEDEEPVATKPKGRLWNLASGVFKGLNKRGIENVNSTENNNQILIGALTISKPN